MVSKALRKNAAHPQLEQQKEGNEKEDQGEMRHWGMRQYETRMTEAKEGQENSKIESNFLTHKGGREYGIYNRKAM